MNEVDNKELIQEDAKDHIFDTGITAEKLQQRKIDLARTIEHTIDALNQAEATGQTALADALAEKLSHLENLFDNVLDAIDAVGSGTGSGESKGEGKGKGESEDKGKDSGKEDDGDNSDKGDGSDEDDGADSDGDNGEDYGEGDSSGGSKEGSHTRHGGRSGNRTSGEGGGGSSGGSDSDGDDGDDGGKDSKGKPQFNPFARRFGGGTSKEKESPEESVFDAAKRILSKLTGDAKKGAADGLSDLLSSRDTLENFGPNKNKKKLQEAAGKTISEMSDEEFDAELNAANELISQVLDIEFSDDLADRVAKIKNLASSRVANAELEADDAQYLRDEKTAKAANAREADKYKKGVGLKGLDAFKTNLFRTVKDQVEESEEDVETWAALDRRHEDDPTIIKKGTIIDDSDDPTIPTINVYFDQSGSWSESEIEIGKRAIRTIHEFEDRKEIKLQIFYISAAGVCDTSAEARRHGGAEGWYDTLQHIVSSKVKNVIVLSDSDLDSFEWSNRPTGNNGKVVVDGCVWWLWKNADPSKKAPKELVGRRGNFHYYFSTR
jgi:hypothetical protein